MTQPRFLRAVEATSVALFFLQALRVVFSVLFGIIYDQVFVGPPGMWLLVSVLLVFLAMVAPVIAPRAPHRAWLAVLASLTALARVALSVDDPRIRYGGCLLVLAFGGLYLAGLMTARRPVAMPAITGALVLDQLLRVAGSTYDSSLRPIWLPLQILWAAAIVIVAIALGRRMAGGERRASLFGIRAGLGLGAFFFLETSLLSLPNAAARWSGESYAMLAPLLLGISLLPLIPRLRLEVHRRLADSMALRLALTMVAGLGVLLAYFVPGIAAASGLLVAQLATLASLSTLLDGQPTRPRSVGAMFALGMVLLLALNFINAFAFTYPYSLPALRGMGWLPYLLAAIAFGGGVLAQHPVALSWSELTTRTSILAPGGLVIMGIAIWAVQPVAIKPLPDTGTLRIATYNIHYGYDRDWHFSLDSMAAAMEQEQVDVATLQEVDTGRLTSYAVDDAVYLGRRLGMNVAYLPTVERLTGIAILYHGPQAPVESRLLSSNLEQTGVLHVTLDVAGQQVNSFGAWLGLENEDTGRQIREALDFIGDRSPASFGGDFNSVMGSPVASAIQAAGFVDPFTALRIQPVPLTDPAVDPTQRIDFVWQRGLTPIRAWVPDSTASDHRIVVVEVKSGG